MEIKPQLRMSEIHIESEGHSFRGNKILKSKTLNPSNLHPETARNQNSKNLFSPMMSKKNMFKIEPEQFQYQQSQATNRYNVRFSDESLPREI